MTVLPQGNRRRSLPIMIDAVSPNSTPQPDARDTLRHWHLSQPRAGGCRR